MLLTDDNFAPTVPQTRPVVGKMLPPGPNDVLKHASAVSLFRRFPLLSASINYINVGLKSRYS